MQKRFEVRDDYMEKGAIYRMAVYKIFTIIINV